MKININAPVIQKKEIIVKEKPDKVWKTLTDINGWVKWNSRITKSKINSTLEIGQSFKWKINGVSILSKLEIIEENKVFGWTGKTFGGKAIHNWYLEEIAEGTLVKVEESMEGWLISLFRKKMNTTLEDDMEYWLNQLKNECEIIV
jgi:hypothetical protein